MKLRRMIAWSLLGLLPHAAAQAAAPNSLILNEANAVSGDSKYLGGGKSDPALGRLEGNGQNWLEFIVAGADAGKHTLDLRGFTIDWQYSKDAGSFGSGTITFSQDPIWAAVPQGTMVTVNEWQKAWYLIDTPPGPANSHGDTFVDGDNNPGGGMQRDGGIDGFGAQKGSAFNAAIDTLRDFSTNTSWNPSPTTPGGPDWNINVWAGEGLVAGSAKYFDFSGTITKGGATTNVGLDAAAGLFSANNDNWQFSIKDSLLNPIQGPIGEAVAGWTAGGVGSDENLKLEAFAPSSNPTVASYLGIGIANYKDGSSSSYGAANRWTSGDDVVTQDLSPLRNWFSSILPGDADLNGTVNFADFQALQNNFGQSGKSWQNGDFDGDGIVSFADFQLLQNNFGQSSGGGGGSFETQLTAVPEPSTLGLLGLGMLASFGYRRRSASLILLPARGQAIAGAGQLKLRSSLFTSGECFMIRSTFVLMLTVSLFATTASATTVSLDLQLNKVAKTYEVFATIDGPSKGLASFSIDIVGAGGAAVTTSTLQVPRPFDADLGEFTGFTLLRSNGATSGSGRTGVRASQDTTASDLAFLIFDVGSASPYLPVKLASGSYTGTLGTLTAKVTSGNFFNLFPVTYTLGSNTFAASSVAPAVASVPEPSTGALLAHRSDRSGGGPISMSTPRPLGGLKSLKFTGICNRTMAGTAPTKPRRTRVASKVGIRVRRP